MNENITGFMKLIDIVEHILSPVALHVMGVILSVHEVENIPVSYLMMDVKGIESVKDCLHIHLE